MQRRSLLQEIGSTRDARIPYDSLIETLTFLSTDIEGSTVTLQRVGNDLYAKILNEHHQIIRRCLEEHGGREESTQGDSFFATFTSPTASVAAAVEMQVELEGHVWPDDAQLLVRIGIHSGEASRESTGIVGYEVHRAARIAGVAHGGQILLSSATKGLVENSLPSGVELRSLGAHHLKDLGRPEVLFQLGAEGLKATFPPLRSLGNPELANNLPTSLSPFIGRVTELTEVRALIAKSRLVTLTGAGGSGKTRLALQAVADFVDGSGEGVWFVELAPVSDPHNVAATVLDAMKIRLGRDRTAMDELLHALRDQSSLVVLDNCEHLIDVVAKMVDSIGRHCPNIRLMTTSREPLGVDGEQIYRVRSLSLPEGEVETAKDLLGSDSAELFVTRARLHDSSMVVDDATATYLASICRRLDGIPLALELAAARVASMSLHDLSQRLDQRFQLLTGGSRIALPRQQTLEAMVSWSYDLLAESERQVLRRLSVFANGFRLDAAEAICASDDIGSMDIPGILGSLVDKNLVLAERSPQDIRYRLLETIRQYTAEQHLQSDGEADVQALRIRHADYFLARCESIAPGLICGPNKVLLLRQIDDEWDDILAAFESVAKDADGPARVLRLGVAIAPYMQTRYQFGPVRQMRDALGQYEGHDLLRARALIWLPKLRPNVIEEDVRDLQLNEFLAMATEAEGLGRELNDRELTSEALVIQALLTDDLGDKGVGVKERALQLVEAALSTAVDLDSAWCVPYALFTKGRIQSFGGFSRTTQFFSLDGVPAMEEAADRYRRIQDPQGLGRSLHTLALAAAADGDTHRSRELDEESLRVAEEVGDTLFVAYAVGDLSHRVFVLGEPELAEAYARRFLKMSRRMGLPHWQAIFQFNNMACSAAAVSDFERAARLLGGVESLEPLMPEHGFFLSNSELEARDDAATKCRAALGQDRFNALVTEGRATPYEQLFNLALRRSASVE
jgi:predicted ATPase/class 3 adenylate cyclase